MAPTVCTFDWFYFWASSSPTVLPICFKHPLHYPIPSLASLKKSFAILDFFNKKLKLLIYHYVMVYLPTPSQMKIKVFICHFYLFACRYRSPFYVWYTWMHACCDHKCPHLKSNPIFYVTVIKNLQMLYSRCHVCVAILVCGKWKQNIDRKIKHF